MKKTNVGIEQWRAGQVAPDASISLAVLKLVAFASQSSPNSMKSFPAGGGLRARDRRPSVD